MGKANFSDDFKRDAVAQITERGYPVGSRIGGGSYRKDLFVSTVWPNKILNRWEFQHFVEIRCLEGRFSKLDYENFAS